MSEANEMGLNWIEGLQYVIEHRDVSDPAVALERRPISPIDSYQLGAGDLRKAG